MLRLAHRMNTDGTNRGEAECGIAGIEARMGDQEKVRAWFRVKGIFFQS